MGIEEASEYYDAYWSKWDVTRRGPSNPQIYAQAVQWAQKHDQIFDVGCGSGGLAKELHLAGWPGEYLGADFSESAIEKFQEMDLPSNFKAIQADMKLHALPRIPLIMVEFLEHVEWDLELFQTAEPGTPVAISVPNFDCVGHVRHFKTFDQVFARYDRVIKTDYATSFSRSRAKWYWVEGWTK